MFLIKSSLLSLPTRHPTPPLTGSTFSSSHQHRKNGFLVKANAIAKLFTTPIILPYQMSKGKKETIFQSFFNGPHQHEKFDAPNTLQFTDLKNKAYETFIFSIICLSLRSRIGRNRFLNRGKFNDIDSIHEAPPP